MSFNKQKYDQEYVKTNYKTITVRTRRDLWLKIDDYCKYNGVSYNDFFKNAAKYIIDEKIDIKGYK